jgi:hypothetical protein
LFWVHQSYLANMIRRHNSAGTLYTHNWSSQPVPPTVDIFPIVAAHQAQSTTAAASSTLASSSYMPLPLPVSQSQLMSGSSHIVLPLGERQSPSFPTPHPASDTQYASLPWLVSLAQGISTSSSSALPPSAAVPAPRSTYDVDTRAYHPKHAPYRIPPAASTAVFPSASTAAAADPGGRARVPIYARPRGAPFPSHPSHTSFNNW